MEKKVNYRKVGGSHDLFSAALRVERLKKMNHPLNTLLKYIDFEMFRPILKKYCNYKGGAPWNEVLMFKIIILQKYYDLSEERTEFEILSNLMFQIFIGLGTEDEVPDKNTIWDFKERLKKKGMDECFDLFSKELEKVGLKGRGGKIIDASFVEVPKRHDKKGEKDTINKGEIPKDWSKKKRAHKDTDARWKKQNNKSHFGYKNHIKVNRKSKVIEKYCVTSANINDDKALESLLESKKTDYSIYADKAYRTQEITLMLKKRGIKNYILEKATRNNPLDLFQNWSNQFKSKTRARVEHVFGIQRKAFKTNDIRTVGRERAGRQIALTNLLYNLTRLAAFQAQAA